MAWLYQCESRTWERQLPTTTVSAGNIFAIHSDSLTNIIVNEQTLLIFYDQNNDNAATILLDLGSARPVAAVRYVNTLSYATNYAARTVRISVAPDETDPAFDVYTSASYTTDVFDGTIQPQSNAAGTVRQADITDVTRRYLLLRFTSNFWGNIDQDNTVFVGDIDVLEP